MGKGVFLDRLLTRVGGGMTFKGTMFEVWERGEEDYHSVWAGSGGEKTMSI